ncbi:MAG: DUF3089 domain-containing protein [Bacteroidota bacterium]
MYKLTLSNIKTIFSICVAVFFVSCNQENYAYKTGYNFKSTDSTPDYGNLNYWAAHPWKWDPSDSVPQPLLKNYRKDSVVDVFFIHPTTFTDFGDERWNAPIDDSLINAKTDYTTILYQASVFNEECRVFAPRYRQAHLRAFYNDDKEKDSVAFDLAYRDVKNSFQYYLEHFNNGHPIIIASHSQGTVHAGKILKEFFEGSVLKNRLVCAYIIGMPIPENYFSELQPCKDSLGTGCFVGWRTVKRNYTDTFFLPKEKFKSYVTNPLTWTLTDEYAPTSLNTGAVLMNFNKLTSGVVDAQVHENVLWTCKPKFFGNILLKKKNYHIGDINLFYTNIRNNVRTRIKMFWKQ